LSMNAAARSLPMVVLALVFDRLLQRRKAEPLGTFSKSQCPDVIFFLFIYSLLQWRKAEPLVKVAKS
jgi:hypothetical protein